MRSVTDYYAFGAPLPGRRDPGTNDYRYGFNGKENDAETGTQDYGFRIYNPSLGKFLSVDPLAPEYPWYTPYQFAGNTPIKYIDLDGAEPTSNLADANNTVEEYAASTPSQSEHFKNITPEQLIENIKQRINDPSGCTQGKGTNFCGPSAIISSTIIQNDPVGYTKFMIDLYKNGEATYNNGSKNLHFKPSQSVMENAGKLKQAGLATNPADQMLLMALKDKYNMGADKEYESGDEESFWASTPYDQFNTIIKELGYNITCSFGSTFGGGGIAGGAYNSAQIFTAKYPNEFAALLKNNIDAGNMAFLFVDTKAWKNNSWFGSAGGYVGTHFIRITDIKYDSASKNFALWYWDYGKSKTHVISTSQAGRAVYGITIVQKPK